MKFDNKEVLPRGMESLAITIPDWHLPIRTKGTDAVGTFDVFLRSICMTRISKPRKYKRPWLWIVLAMIVTILLVLGANWMRNSPYMGPVYPTGVYGPGMIVDEQPGKTSEESSAPTSKGALPADE